VTSFSRAFEIQPIQISELFPNPINLDSFRLLINRPFLHFPLLKKSLQTRICKPGATRLHHIIFLVSFRQTQRKVETIANLFIERGWDRLTEELRPPSKFMVQLFAYWLRTRKTAASATSSGVPNRPAGILDRISCRWLLDIAVYISI